MSRVLKAYLENRVSLRRYLSKFRGRQQDVEDLAQEAFVKAFAVEKDTDIEDPKAFLFRVARNLALNEVRKSARSPTDTLEDFGGADVVIGEEAIADEKLDARNKLMVFATAMAELSPRCREVFWMARVDGLKYKQIATRLNITVSAVEKNVARALLKCAQRFRIEGYDPSEIGLAEKKARRLGVGKEYEDG